MFFQMKRTLGYVYSVLTQASGRVSNRDIKRISEGALAMAENAEAICAPPEDVRPNEADQLDLDTIRLFHDHIEEMQVILLHQEIV